MNPPLPAAVLRLLGRGVEIRRASPDEAEVLSRIAFEAKEHWGYPERWMERWRAALTVSPSFVRENEVFAAVVEGEVAGFFALVGEGERLELDHLWVSPGRIGTGLGRLLFERAMGRAAELGARAVKIESEPNAEGFYRRMGARRTGENAYRIEGKRRELPIMTVEIPPPRAGAPDE